jgi:hypothetical protein
MLLGRAEIIVQAWDKFLKKEPKVKDINDFRYWFDDVRISSERKNNKI